MKEILITSSVLIVALLLLRLVFSKKVSRKLIYGAWILVALRLLIPVQIGQLDFSVLTAAQDVTQTIEQVATRPVSGPSKQEVYQDIVVDYLEKDQTVFVPHVQEQIRQEISQGTTNPADIADKIQQKYPQQEVFVPQVQEQVQQQVEQTQTGPTLGQVAKTVWLAGVAVMAVWFTIVNVRYGLMLRRNREPLACESPIPVFVSEKVGSPCLVGLFHPVINLTPRSAAREETLRHVLTHELTHYRHGDHVWSLVRCICLCVYWFDPLVWLAAYMSRRDCELACDAGAMKVLGEAERLAYGKTLLEVVSHASAPAHLMQTATSMNETKKQLKERVGYIVKKPKFSIIAAICMVLVCAIVAGCVAAGPTSTQKDPPATTPTTTPTTMPTTSPSTSGSTQPTDPRPTEPEPTEPIDEELAKFNALFGNLDSWYNKALTSEYVTPEQLDLMLFFLATFPEESNQVTDSERAQLKDLYGYSDYIDMIDITCLPVDKMNQVLQEYFGITLEDVEAAGFHELDYLESTNCYYIVGNGASGAMDFNALSAETLEDGSIRLTYTQFTGSNDEVYVVTLMPHGDGYRILSNMALRENTEMRYQVTVEKTDETYGIENATMILVYNERGDLLEHWEGYWKILYTYDAQGNVLSEKTYHLPDKLVAQTDYTYDAQGRLIQTANFGHSGGELADLVQYSYDSNGNLIGIQLYENGEPAGGCIYDANGNLTEKYWAGNVQRELYTYTAEGKPQSKYTELHGAPHSGWEKTYDASGRPIRMEFFRMSGDVRKEYTNTYTYDENGRCIRYDMGGFQGEQSYETYTYDAAGNILSCEYHNYDGSSSGHYWTYDQKGRITSWKSTNRQGTTTYTWDCDEHGIVRKLTQDGPGADMQYSFHYTWPETEIPYVVWEKMTEHIERFTGVSVYTPERYAKIYN